MGYDGRMYTGDYHRDSKNPSTAAGTMMPGNKGYGINSMQGGGNHAPSESFDLDFMLPPDIASIDSDINKLGAMTPSPGPNFNPMGPPMTSGLHSNLGNVDFGTNDMHSQYDIEGSMGHQMNYGG